MRTTKTLLCLAALVVACLVVPVAPAAASGPLPLLQAPFPCGQSWRGDSGRSTAHKGTYEIDFNRGGTPTADLGDTVVAAARGRVVTAANQGSRNGYGNLVKIDHGNGWSTYYAHLRSIDVRSGASVRQGQKIGELGNTSKPGNPISPHLHFEVRNDGSYPGSVQPARFDGTRFAYPEQSVVSRNCDDPERVCGTGFRTVDQAYLRNAAGVHQGTVYLTWNASTSTNCVVTVKHRNRATASATSAYLEPAGTRRSTDSGAFTSYAGPVRRSAPGCIRWGGATGGAAYDSPREHC